MDVVKKLLEYTCHLCGKQEKVPEAEGVHVILAGRTKPVGAQGQMLSLEMLLKTGEAAVVCLECEEKLLAPIRILKEKRGNVKLGDPEAKPKTHRPKGPLPPYSPPNPVPTIPHPWTAPPLVPWVELPPLGPSPWWTQWRCYKTYSQDAP